MSTSGTSDKPHGLYDVSRAFPLSENFVNNPSGLCYHRFYDDSGTEQEIFVPPGREQEILDLDKNRDWNALLKFPAFSDRPPPPPIRGNCVGFPEADGTIKDVYVPEDDASQARMSELMIAQDYKAMEQEFEPWSKYKPATSLVL
jgi:hypothetical protein